VARTKALTGVIKLVRGDTNQGVGSYYPIAKKRRQGSCLHEHFIVALIGSWGHEPRRRTKA